LAKNGVLKKIILAIGIVLAFLVIGWAAILSYPEPSQLIANTYAVEVLAVIALVLIIYGSS